MLDRISYQTALDMIVQHFYCKGLYRILDTAHIELATFDWREKDGQI
jgi:hypothetical protein